MGVMSVREFNQNVSKALAQVEAGEEIILTRHGKRIARVTREGLLKDDEQRQKNVASLNELMEQGIDFGGPATYEERTGR